ncbi:YciI family protein [Hoyosella subflava]|nr:YciI family protein [Hoyosella subflava]
MHYFALLIGAENENEVPGTPEFEAAVAGYEEFDRWAGDSVVWGVALHSVNEGMRRKPDGMITDGPFTESAEVVGGLYVLAAENLDDAIEIARRIPAAMDGAIEMWPMAEWTLSDNSYSENWVALIREPASDTPDPGTSAWDSGVAEHEKFGSAAREWLRGGGALYPSSAATTIRVRDGKLLLSDGPYIESAEVVNGIYLFKCDEEEARALAARVPTGPRGGIEMRKVVSF